MVGCWPMRMRYVGFTTALRHVENAHDEPVWPLLRRRLAASLPLLLGSSLLSLCIAATARGTVFTGEYVMMLFGLQAWRTPLRRVHAALPCAPRQLQPPMLQPPFCWIAGCPL